MREGFFWTTSMAMLDANGTFNSLPRVRVNGPNFVSEESRYSMARQAAHASDATPVEAHG